MKLGLWSTTPGSNNSTPPDGWPEGQAPSTVNDCAREMMAAVRTYAQGAEFFDHGMSPTFVSTTTFTVPGDQSSFLATGKRLKLFDATTIFRTVSTVSASSNTNVILKTGTNITVSLSSFAIGILSNANSGVPDNLSLDTITIATSGVANYFTASALVCTTLNIVSGCANSGSYRGQNGNAGFPTYLFDGTDTDTGYYWISDGILAASCNNSESFRLSAGGFVARAYTVTSDSRTKADWQPIPPDTVVALAAMQAGSYTRVKDGTRAIGVAAQDLASIFPECVHTNDAGTMVADYGPAAMAACVALAAELEELRAEIRLLKERK